jgi:hypothetical protein
MDLARFVQDNGLSTGIVIFIGWFLVGKVWPYYTGVYLPQVMGRQTQREQVMEGLRDAIWELRALTVQLVNAIQQHDVNSRDLIIALGSNQQAILDLLHEQLGIAVKVDEK